MLFKLFLFGLVSSTLVLSEDTPLEYDRDALEEARTVARGIGNDLIVKLKNKPLSDESRDYDYDDLRAELLAYHTALTSLTDKMSKNSRRSLTNTACWSRGGICVNYKLCYGEHYLSEVSGCSDKLNVCCLSWNKFKVRDIKGFPNLAYPWIKAEPEHPESELFLEPLFEKK